MSSGPVIRVGHPMNANAEGEVSEWWRSMCCRYPVYVIYYSVQCMKCHKSSSAYNIYPTQDQYSEIIRLMEP